MDAYFRETPLHVRRAAAHQRERSCCKSFERSGFAPERACSCRDANLLEPIAMKNFARLSLLMFVLSLALRGGTAAEPELAGDILGLRVDMPKAAVQKRLQEIGKFVRDERKRQEIWEVRDERFSHVIVGFDAKETLRYVTATAREDKEAKRVKYDEVGDLEQARQAGDPAIKNFNYEWRLSSEKGSGEALVIARGRDPEYLSTSYSIKRLAEDKEDDEETAGSSPAPAKEAKPRASAEPR